jgi:hypothetical protein
LSQGRTLRYLRETTRIRPVTRRDGTPGYVWDSHPLMVCRDGFSMSVQASPTHYCNMRNYYELGDSYEPKWPIDVIPHMSAEVYKVDPWDPLFNEYGDGEDPLGWVPLEVIDQVIEKHGGLVGDPLPTMRTRTGKRLIDL